MKEYHKCCRCEKNFVQNSEDMFYWDTKKRRFICSNCFWDAMIYD